MKRYFVFAGDCYYPGGGVSDFIADFYLIEEAKTHVCNHTDWSHILDTETGVVHETDRDGKWVSKPIKEWQF